VRGILRKARALDVHDAKSLTGWGLHHNPTLQSLNNACAKLLQPRHFARHVVRLNVDMDAAFMLDALDLHDGFVGLGRKHAIVSARARMVEIDRATQRLGPEARGFVHVRHIAIDQHRAKTGIVHAGSLGLSPLFSQRDDSIVGRVGRRRNPPSWRTS
jgi:hypothetical protein